MTMEHKIGYLALIGSIAPMLGLLGTVQGMIDAFSVIASSDASPKPKDLAAGISTAMVTTLAGLIVCIPAMIAYSMFKNRMSRLVLEVGVVSEGLMARFNRKPGGGGAPVPAQRRVITLERDATESVRRHNGPTLRPDKRPLYVPR